MTERIEFGFVRTECGCRECVRCCEHMPAMLVPSDLPRMAAAKGQTAAEFALQYLQASPGATVVANGELLQIPTLTPAQREDGSCVFLEQGRCTVHAVAPYGCAFMDVHMPVEQGEQRSARGLVEIMNARHGEYALIWNLLRGKKGLGPTASEKRAKLLAAMNAEPPRV